MLSIKEIKLPEKINLTNIKKTLKNRLNLAGKACLNNLFWFYTFIAIFLKTLIIMCAVKGFNVNLKGMADTFLCIPTLAVYLSFILIILSFAFLFKRRGRLWFLIILDIIISLVFLFDVWNFRGFSSFTSLYMLKQTANLENLGDSIISMIHLSDILLILDIPVLIFLALYKRKKYTGGKRNIILFALLFLIPAGYISYAHYEFDLSSQRGVKQYLFVTKWTPSTTITNLSPVGYHLYDAFQYFIQNRKQTLSAQEKKNVQKWYEDKKENLPDNQYKGMFKGMNLLMIQVESLEGFYIDNKVDGQEITPNLNSLLKNSFYFPNFYEQVNNGTTSDAELMSNTSVYPVRQGSTYFRYPENKYNSMPILMQKLGYSTTAIHPDKGAYWNWKTVLTSFGYNRCIDASNFKQDETIGLGLSDGSYLRQVAPIIKSEKQPFYTYLITLTNHVPFYLPDKYKELDLESKFKGTYLGNSFQTVHYTDKQLGIFLNNLKQSGVLDNTVVVIYGDHSGVHKYDQYYIDQIHPRDDWWYDNKKHVPFIIYQDKLQGRVMDTIGGEIDILPTISYLMGVDENSIENTAMGRNLFNTGKNFAVMVDGTYIGDSTDKKQKQHDINGLGVADKIICSDYFSSK
ncbi:MAG: LTA synthase family protein [Bacillota bacterium]|nr:LTA synthase family protein [Bacillota bacterium]